MKRTALISVTWIIALILVVPAAASQTIYEFEDFKIIPPTAEKYDRFGNAVSLDGDVALIGKSGDDDNTGSAYIFRRDSTGWIEEAWLTASDAATYDRFGCEVAIEGDIALVAAKRDEDHGPDSGSVYVFHHDASGWVETTKLTASLAADNYEFGRALSLDGNKALIGVGGDGVTSTGAAYIFRREGSDWTEEARLTASSGNFQVRSVCLVGDTAAVGASGRAFVFRFDGSQWTEEDWFDTDNPESGGIGSAIGYTGNWVLVGARQDSEAAFWAGAVYAFRHNGTSWIEEAKLTASNANWWDHFGSDLVIRDDVAVITAPMPAPAAPPESGDSRADNGLVYIFRPDGTTWAEEMALRPAVTFAGHNVGSAVAVSGDTILVGASGDYEVVAYGGAAFGFQLLDGTVGCSITCAPAAGTLPFVTNMTVTIANRYNARARRAAASIRANLAGGQQWSNWKSGYTNLDPGEVFVRVWNQIIPGVVSVVGDNVFTLSVEDVTPPPYNQPPFVPSGDRDTDACTVTGAAP